MRVVGSLPLNKQCIQYEVAGSLEGALVGGVSVLGLVLVSSHHSEGGNYIQTELVAHCMHELLLCKHVARY